MAGRGTSLLMEYYTYLLIDSRNQKPFYVGKGHGKRMYRHESSARRRKPPHNNYSLYDRIREIISSGASVVYRKVLVTENENETLKKEIELIAEIGRKNLCNLTDGGDGVSKGTVPWNKGKTGIYSAETLRKIGEAGKKRTGTSNHFYGRHHSEETKRKISEAKMGHISPRKGVKLSTETRKKIGDVQRGRKLTEEHKRNISNGLRKYYSEVEAA